MTRSWWAAIVATLPDTGASMNEIFLKASAFANSRALSTPLVPISTIMRSFFTPSKTSWSSSKTEWVTWPFVNKQIAISASARAALGVGDTVKFGKLTSVARLSAAVWLRFHSVKWNPEAANSFAMAEPILPTPSIAIDFILDILWSNQNLSTRFT